MLRPALAAVLSLLLVALPAWADPDNTQTAGAVKALIPNASDNAHPLAVNDQLHWNDLLQTNGKGRLLSNQVNFAAINHREIEGSYLRTYNAQFAQRICVEGNGLANILGLKTNLPNI